MRRQFSHLCAPLSKEMLLYRKMRTKLESLSDSARVIGLDPLSSFKPNLKKKVKKRMIKEVLPEREKAALETFMLFGIWRKL